MDKSAFELGAVVAIAMALVEVLRAVLSKAFDSNGQGRRAEAIDAALRHLSNRTAEEAIIRRIEETARETKEAIERLEAPIRKMEAHLQAIRLSLTRTDSYNGER
jgi:ferritin-like metal-binding protein YciE